MKGIVLGLMVMMGLLGCTKEKPFEEVENKQTVNKGSFPKSSLDTFYGLSKEEEELAKKPVGQLGKLCEQIVGREERRVVEGKEVVVRPNARKSCAQLKSDAVEKQRRLNSYIAVVSYGQASRTAEASMPYFLGRAKLVKFDVSEHMLEIREIEKDKRFEDNPTNSRLVLSIPVRHVDYRCQTDAYGDCQNKEEEDDSKDWDKKRFIELSLDKVEAHDVDELPVELTNLFDGCYNATATKLISKELTDGVINIEIERSYQIAGKAECLSGVSSLEDLNFDVRYMYSIVRAEKIASGDYVPVNYKREDENTFGFFTTERKVLDVDNSSNEGTDLVLMNRWSPTRKVLKYHLSETFAKPENDYVLEATIKGIQNINTALAQAQTGLQIELVMPSADKKVGDLRNNHIVLVDDPLAFRIIGYGPSVGHPLTGEIVNARTVMYLGTIKTLVRRTYEEIRDEVLEQQELAKIEELKKDFPALTKIAVNLRAQTKKIFGRDSTLGRFASKVKPASSEEAAIAAMNLTSKQLGEVKKRTKSQIQDVILPSMDRIKKEVLSFKTTKTNALLTEESRYLDKRIENLSRLNVYPEELFNAHFAFESSGVKEQLGANIPKWEDLSSEQKEEIVRTVLPHIWVPTLVHEVGHNLGLRHNFAGSEDKANFYTQDELTEMGIKREIPYSSVMEYSYKTLNELSTMGKYDIAALRYAYKREVELDNSEIVVVKDNLKETQKELAAQGKALKDYRYCTDEHVSANPTCNRFDEGTNILEIATHFVESYEERFKTLNYRNQRRDFSLFNEGAYTSRIANHFYFLRLMFELHDRIRTEFGIPDGHPIWQQNAFLKQILDASTLSGQFFLSVLMTPDTQCAVAVSDNPFIPLDVVPIRVLGRDDATSCYHPVVEETLKEIGDQFGLDLVVAGEGGKSFRTRKDSRNENPFADQVDVQGVWIDKLLAAEMLTVRELGSRLFDGSTNNYLSHPTIGRQILPVLAAVTLERGQIEVPFRNQDGRPALFLLEDSENPETPVVTDLLPVSFLMREDHNADVPELRGLSRYFGLPNQMTHYRRELLRTVKSNLPSKISPLEEIEFNKFFEIFEDYDLAGSQFETVQLSTKRLVAPRVTNSVSVRLMRDLKLSRVSDENLAKVVEVLKQKQVFDLAEFQGLVAAFDGAMIDVTNMAVIVRGNQVNVQASGVAEIERHLATDVNSRKETSFLQDVLTYLL